MTKDTKNEKELMPALKGVLVFQGLKIEFDFVPEEIKNEETVKNKLYINFRKLFNKMKEDVKNQAKLHSYIHNL